MNDMNVQLWSRLPTDMVERTLSFLSVPVLCRFRTVCKRWNSFICNPKFGDLCIQHARQRDACFLVACYTMNGEDVGDYDVAECVRSSDSNHRWSFLDLSDRRWYTIKHDEPKAYDNCLHREYGCCVAMDGGLVCECFVEVEEQVAVFVSNPIAKTSKRLPSYPFNHITVISQVNMAVDNIAQSYKIFVMPYILGEKLRSVDNPSMIVYESKTNLWRSLTNPPMQQITEVCIYAQCSLFHDGLLYILMSTDVGAGECATGFWLWSYNHVEDTWNDTGVNILLELAYPQLLVCDNRLFLGSWLRKPLVITRPHSDQASRLSYEVREVNLKGRTCSTALLRMTGAVLAHAFECPAKTLDRDGVAPFAMTAFGLGKSIVLIQCGTAFGEDSSGVSMVYDVSTNSWDLLPKDLWSPLSIRDPYSGSDMGPKPMNLILPASILWVEAQVCSSPWYDMSLPHWNLCT